MSRMKTKPETTDEVDLRCIYAFAYTEEICREIADGANKHGITRKGMFVPGSFEVRTLPYRLPAVCGTLTGKGL